MDTLTQKLFNAIKNKDDRQFHEGKLVDLLGDRLYSEENSNDGVNFHPGKPTNHCSRKAYFVSLTEDMGSFGKDQSISLEKILDIMFKQVFVNCLNKNKEIVLIVDKIDMKIFEKFSDHFDLLNKQVDSIQIYYFGNEKISDFTNAIIG